MEQNKKTYELLTMHYQKYPHLQIRDIFKYIYQSAFGCEHMVTAPDAVTEYIIKESRINSHHCDVLIDRLDGAYSRVHLAYLNHGLSAETLGRLFFMSAKKEAYGKAAIENKLKIAKKLVQENLLPFSAEQFDKEAEEWQNSGFPPVHHSGIFRTEYCPSYRVIANEYVPFLPFFAKLDKMFKSGPKVVAVEGGSASGKTTLSEILKALYDCSIIHMDDFFLRPEQRTPERYAEIGGNIDRERFLEEVLTPLSEKKPINYRKFDCSTMTISDSDIITPEKTIIIEGAYSMHPEFAKYYDFSAFLDISPCLQRTRIAKRNLPQIADRFYNEWIPLERLYFSKLNIKERCDISIQITE